MKTLNRDVRIVLRLTFKDAEQLTRKAVRAYVKQAATGCTCYLNGEIDLAAKVKRAVCTRIFVSAPFRRARRPRDIYFPRL